MKQFLFALSALLLTGCGADAVSASGWVEADPALYGAEEPGRIERILVREGDAIAAGTPLFVLDATLQTADRMAAEAEWARAKALLERAQASVQGQEQIAAARAQLKQAEAAAQLSALELERKRKLAADGTVAKGVLDAAEAAAARDRAAVEQARELLAAAEAAGRSEDIEAAAQTVAAAQARLSAAKAREQRRTVSAVAPGIVQDVIYQPGEQVMAARPVIAVLGADQIKLRFYVPQAHLWAFAPGTRISASCDGCAEPIGATVSFVAAEAEFTPPVIYSRDERAKLVFLVEARPDAPSQLRPGQPINVGLP